MQALTDPLRYLRAAAVLLCALACAGSPPAIAGEALDFELFRTLQAIDERAVEPRPGDGEVLLLQFWASWCHSCGALMWDMDEMASANPAAKYIAISLDEDPLAARAYIRRHALFEKYRGRYFIDAEKRLATALDVETVPGILLIDPQGVVLARKSGHLNSTDFHDLVLAIRGQATP